MKLNSQSHIRSGQFDRTRWSRSLVAMIAICVASSAWSQLGRPPSTFESTAFKKDYWGIDAGVQPYVRFKQGDFLDTEGSLFWFNQTHGITDNRSFSFGGWIVFKGLDNAWQLHLSHTWAMPRRDAVSLQAAVLGGTDPRNAGKKDYSVFGIYSKAETISRYESSWTVGAGVYSYSASNQGTKPSLFAGFSLQVAPDFLLDANYWTVQGPSGEPGIVRYGFGFSYRW